MVAGAIVVVVDVDLDIDVAGVVVVDKVEVVIVETIDEGFKVVDI